MNLDDLIEELDNKLVVLKQMRDLQKQQDKITDSDNNLNTIKQSIYSTNNKPGSFAVQEAIYNLLVHYNNRLLKLESENNESNSKEKSDCADKPNCIDKPIVIDDMTCKWANDLSLDRYSVWLLDQEKFILFYYHLGVEYKINSFMNGIEEIKKEIINKKGGDMIYENNNLIIYVKYVNVLTRQDKKNLKQDLIKYIS
nr:putative histone demethylase [Megavirus caiporensis]